MRWRLVLPAVIRARRPAVAAVAMLLGVIAAQAQETSSAEPPARVATRHSMVLDGRHLDYQAIAEMLPLTDAKGTHTASVFTTTYLVDPTAAGPESRPQRPVSFVFNGGPGAASVFLHLGAIGPEILDTPATGSVPPPPVRLVDNPSTWLGFTDLVFVDPVGTGFSRGEGKGDNPDQPFFEVRADLASLGAVVRLWLTRHRRWDMPVYLVGESYGGFRVAAMTETLAHDFGVTVSGAVMISPALDLSVLHDDTRDLVGAASGLPSYAAARSVLAGSPLPQGDLAGIERYALSDYLVGLAAVAGQPPASDPFIARVAGIVGLPADLVARDRGRVSRRLFAREIRRPQGEQVSLYDATVARAASGSGDEAGDPVLDPAISAYTAAFETYAATVLDYRTDQPYRVLPRAVSRHWEWDGAQQGDGLGLAMNSLEAALLDHPGLKVMIANGRYDLVTPYLGSRWLVDQLAVPDAVRAAIRLRVYDGGHMMYMRPASRAALAEDAAALFAAGNAAPPR